MADGRRAHDIIRNVRNTIKKGDPNRRRINLNELVTKVARIARPDAAAYSCEVETSLAEGPATHRGRSGPDSAGPG